MANKQVYIVTNEDFENVYNVFNNLVEYHGFTITGLTLPKVDGEAYIRLKSDSLNVDISLQLCNFEEKVGFGYFNVYIDKHKSNNIKESYIIYRSKLNDKDDIANAFEITRDYLLR